MLIYLNFSDLNTNTFNLGKIDPPVIIILLIQHKEKAFMLA